MAGILERERPLGVFDSGVGGLTVLRELQRQLPHETMIYLGDTARLPYGTKSGTTVERYALQAASALIERSIKLLVVACNTASAHALAALRRHHPELPIIGVIEPGAAAACAASRTGRIAVIATEGTVQTGIYEREIARLRPGADVRSVSASLLVALAEEGWVEGPIAEAVVRRYLAPFLAPGTSAPLDCLVLGCTHFPLLRDCIAAVMGPGITLIDSATAVAEAVAAQLDARRLRVAAGMAPPPRLLATDGRERFARQASRFLGMAVSPGMVELVELGSGASEDAVGGMTPAAL